MLIPANGSREEETGGFIYISHLESVKTNIFRHSQDLSATLKVSSISYFSCYYSGLFFDVYQIFMFFSAACAQINEFSHLSGRSL